MQSRRTFALWLFLLFVPIASAQVYKITDLGTLPTGTFSTATGINNFGHVTGEADILNRDSEEVDRAFLWTKKSGMEDLGTLPNPYDDPGFASSGNAVNDLDLVVGGSWFDPINNHAFIWSRTGGMQDLGLPPGMQCSYAQSINLFGQVVGTASDYPAITDTECNSYEYAFLWTSGGGTQLLGHLPDGQYSSAYVINGLGQVVGIADTGEIYPGIVGNLHAFLWTTRNGMVDLGAWSALAINDLGEVVGYNAHAVLWTRNRGLQDLGTLPGGNSSSAAAINDFGWVVGWSTTANSTSHAMLWLPHSGMWDLNNLIPANSGWVLDEATGINIFGQIVGNGTINGQEHAFLLTPHL